MAGTRKKKRRVMFIVEIIVLLVFIGGLFVYGQINSKLNKIVTPNVENFDREQVAINVSAPQMTGYTNIALFALDHRDVDVDVGGENSDTMILASINNDTKEVKLASIYRDTLLNIGDNNYQKCNAAYNVGGPQQALSMINTNLDLNIQDYVTVDFKAMVVAVDMLGGLDVPLSYAEMVHLNNYSIETGRNTNTDYVPLELPAEKPEDEEAIIGTYHLSGVQAVSYCRIRYTASLDMGRTERQRRVINLMVEKAKQSSIATLSEIMDAVFPYVETSFSKSDILKMGLSMLSYNMGETTGFPLNYQFANLPTKGDVILTTTLEANVEALHQFLFPDEPYTPSDVVIDRSNALIDLTGYGLDGEIVKEGALSEMTDALENDETFGVEVLPGNYSTWDTGSQGDLYGDGSYTGGDYTGDYGYTGEDYTGGYGYSEGTDYYTGGYGYTGGTDYTGDYGYTGGYGHGGHGYGGGYGGTGMYGDGTGFADNNVGY